MATFMQGAQLSSGFILKSPRPIDTRDAANTIEEVLTQYPVSCRYLGMKVFVETENKYYVFSKHQLPDGTMSTGLTDDDFRPLEANGSIEVDGVLSNVSKNPVENRVIYAHMDTLQKKLVVGENMDEAPTEDSQLPISSGAVHKAISGLKGELLYRGYYKDFASLSLIVGAVPNNFVTVERDETKDGQKTKYIYGELDDGTLGWVFDGYLGSTEVQINDEAISEGSVWSSEKVSNEIEKQHQPYQAGIPLVMGEMYVESHSLYKCLANVPSEENLAFALLPEGTMELVVGNGDIRQCEYDEASETLILNKLTMDAISYDENTQVLSIFET